MSATNRSDLPKGDVRAVVRLADTMRAEVPNLAPVVESLIHRGELVVLAAAPGTGKTPLITQLVTCVSSGKPFLGLPTNIGPTVLVDTESAPADLMALLKRQAGAIDGASTLVEGLASVFVRGLPSDPNSRQLDEIMGKSSGARWSWLEQIIASQEAHLGAIDTLLTFNPFASKDEGRAREHFARLADVARSGSRPALLSTVHLRKRDRRAKVPSLLEDPYGWTEEILGSVVFSASADVRLGLERLSDDRIVLAGFRRGRGTVGPFILEPTFDDGDSIGPPEPHLWVPCSGAALADQVLTDRQFDYFKALEVGRRYRWTDLLASTGAGKSSLYRFLEAARGARLVIKLGDGQYQRPE